ncbi:M61 family metallopeptidase [Flocculibacter collagenilyticus]|uniref:M61 family metallopeptidase n=1 Tax=Flocculibacter collagenilyticus TaxID=2744479 RepID=UPI0018F4F3D8|nr:PDZ domain-containing protein [Flocculibacter collagenilyticus]
MLSAVAMSFTASATVQYQLEITQPEHHLADITVTLPEVQADYVDVKLPAWRTGRYEILDLANGIRFFQPTDEQQQPLKWEKVEKSTWRVYLPSATSVNLAYQVYANQLGKRSRHIDDSHAFIDASGYFMYADQFRNDDVTVTLEVPNNWRSVSGMKQGDNAHSFVAENYDVLIDSPIETGINSLHKFEQNGKEYEVVFWGKGNYDEKQTVADFKKLVAQYNAIWHDIPFERYVFMVHATTNSRGATEHLNSTIIQRKRFTFAPREQYLEFLSTASHEFVHTWNVKAYRPDGLVPYDYIAPNYSELLWISEGSTSYFQDQLLLRAEIMQPKEFFKKLAKRIERHMQTPGKEAQTVAQASFDSWINMRGDHGRNFSTNIYSEGFLVSWLLDFNLLKETDLKASYRDVHSELYKKYKTPHGFTKADVLNILNGLTGESYQAWWTKNVEGPLNINFESLLAQAGLKMHYGKKAKDTAYTGISTKNVNGFSTVTMVKKDSPAWKAGLTSDDVIIAVDGLKLAGGDFKKRIKDFNKHEQVSLTYFRNDELRKATIKLETVKDKPLSVDVIENPTEQQKATFKAWLGIDYPEKKAQTK